MRYRKRVAIITAVVAWSVVLAGCQFAGGGSPVEVTNVKVENGDTSPHTVHLLVTDSDPVHWSSHTVDGSTVRPLDFPAGPYERGTMYVRLDGERLENATTLDFSAYDSECLQLLIEISNASQPSGTPRVSMFHSPEC